MRGIPPPSSFRLEDVRERAPDFLQRDGIAVTRYGSLLKHVEPAHVVEAHDVIRVAMGEQDRVHPIEAAGEGLGSEIRGRVDEHPHAAQFDQHRGTAPAVARIRERQVPQRQPIIGTPATFPCREPDGAAPAHGWMMATLTGPCRWAATYRMRRS